MKTDFFVKNLFDIYSEVKKQGSVQVSNNYIYGLAWKATEIIIIIMTKVLKKAYEINRPTLVQLLHRI